MGAFRKRLLMQSVAIGVGLGIAAGVLQVADAATAIDIIAGVTLAAARALRPLSGVIVDLERIGRGDFAVGAKAGGCREFERLRSQDAGWRAYDRWFSGDIDNARLASVTAYHRFEDGFLRLLADDGGDLEAFYAACEALSKQGPEERERILAPTGSTVASSGG